MNGLLFSANKETRFNLHLKHIKEKGNESQYSLRHGKQTRWAITMALRQFSSDGMGRVGQDVRSTENLADSLSWGDKAEGPRKPRCLECAGQSTGDMKVAESIRRGSPHPQVLS